MGEPARRLSYAEYLELAASQAERVEYHDGMVVAMAAPSSEHARIASRIVQIVGAHIGERPCVVLSAGLKVRVEATNRTLIPDATVVCGTLERSSIDTEAVTNPLMLFEVLSPSTESYDQGAKFHHYRRIPSLREYVVVAQDRRYVGVARRTGAISWAFDDVEAGGRLELRSIELSIELEALYRDALGVITP